MTELPHRLEADARLDRGRPILERVAGAVPAATRPWLRGEPLGHPAHPMLTDLPIGFWTTASVLDVIGGRRCAGAATAMVGLGVATVLPTAAAGVLDWTELGRGKQRVGVVHAVANLAATGIYAASLAHRLRGRRGRGVLTALAGMGVATLGGLLGGHLAFGQGTDTAADAGSDERAPQHPLSFVG
ncbi:MAG: DUF2231 domain-containing protein [Acidimicrobiales bacterium]